MTDSASSEAMNDPRLETASAGTTYQLIILVSAIVFWVLFAVCVRQYLPQAAQTVRRIAGIPTSEAQEARKKFVDANLKSVEWSGGSLARGKVASDEEKGENAETNESSDNQEDGDECPVCLATIQPGDMVSSSTNEACPHVFHRDCIYEWLLRKKGCPMCRNPFLVEPDDGGGAAEANSPSQALTDESVAGDMQDPQQPNQSDTGNNTSSNLEEGRA